MSPMLRMEEALATGGGVYPACLHLFRIHPRSLRGFSEASPRAAPGPDTSWREAVAIPGILWSSASLRFRIPVHALRMIAMAPPAPGSVQPTRPSVGQSLSRAGWSCGCGWRTGLRITAAACSAMDWGQWAGTRMRSLASGRPPFNRSRCTTQASLTPTGHVRLGVLRRQNGRRASLSSSRPGEAHLSMRSAPWTG